MKIDVYKLSKLISKHVQNELSASERLLLEEWLGENLDNRRLFERLIKTEQLKRSLDHFNSLNVDSSWKRAKRKRFVTKVKNLTPYIGYAASIVGVIFTMFLLFPKNNKEQTAAKNSQIIVEKDLLPGGVKATLKLSDGNSINLNAGFRSISQESGYVIFSDSGELDYTKSKPINTHLVYNTITVPKAGTFRIILPDGTKVWLNSLTQLKFPTQFSKQIRKVHLTGEAYFEVAKDRTKPFIVKVNNNTIEVLGTHFNVNSYNTTFKTTLFEGSVKIANDDDSRLLSPGQEASIVGSKIIVDKANMRKALAWKNNEFYFKNYSMQSILLELSRWYDFEIDHHGIINNKRYSGSIGRDLKLSEVLKILHYLSGYNFHFDGNKLTVRNNI